MSDESGTAENVAGVDLADEPLGDYSLEGFFSGLDGVDSYARDRIVADRDRYESAPYVVVDRIANGVAGYYTLSNHVVRRDSLHRSLRDRLRHGDVPATLIGMLGLQTGYQNRCGCGRKIIELAAARCVALSRQSGSAVVIVDSAPEAHDYYAHFGFKDMPGVEGRMYRSMREIERALSEGRL